MRQRFLLALLMLATLSCEPDTEIERDPNKIILDLGPQTATALADGVTETQLYAVLPDESLDSLAKVTFTTTFGKLRFGDSIGKTQTIKANLQLINGVLSRRAFVYLVSDQAVRTTQVTAKVLGYERTIAISFTNARPQTLRLSASTSIIRPSLGSEITFTATLKRSVGMPTLGNQVKLMITDTTGIPIGNLRQINDLSDATGLTTFIYNLPSSFTGRIRAVAETIDENSKPIRDTTYIFSIKP